MKNGLLTGEFSLIDYLCRHSASALEALPPESFLERETAMLMVNYWISVRDAHKNGKKLVLFGGSLPVELLYAMDCVPLYLDLLPLEISPDADTNADLINQAEIHLNQNLCSLNKTLLGSLLAVSYGFEPDAFVYSALKCQSSDTALDQADTLLKIPRFRFNLPARVTVRSIEFAQSQILSLIDFLEELTGKPLNLEQLQYRCGLADKASALLDSCAKLRMTCPCPLSSRITATSGLVTALGPTEELCALLQMEFNLAALLSSNLTPACPGGEKHRVYLLQNLKNGGSDLIRWLENSYGASTVMEGFRYEFLRPYGEISSISDFIAPFASRLIASAPLHDSSELADILLENVGRIFRDFTIDVPIMLGNVGCRHTWSLLKVLTDYIYDNFGLSTLFVEVNGTDLRHKPLDDIQRLIGEFMDTVINAKH